MNHFMMPARSAASAAMADDKCGDIAIRKLVRMAEISGSPRNQLEARLFGGGSVVEHLRSVQSLNQGEIGRRNQELAETLLQQAGIRVVQRDLGGHQGRKIAMESISGQVEVRLIEKSHANKARSDRLSAMSGRKIRVLVVDDSATVRAILSRAINGSTDMEVVAEADTPFSARERLLEVEPDVICLDIIMPRMDGIRFLEKLMAYRPIPTVICSTIAKEGSAMAKRARTAGARAVIDKEELGIHRGLQAVQERLIPQLRRAARAG